MSFIKRAALSGLFAIAASAAISADLPHPALPPAPVIDDAGEGWYLRGDIGFAAHRRPEADFSSSTLGGSLEREDIDNTAVAGLGIGYRFSPHFRADITLDQRFDTLFQATASAPDFPAGTLTDKGLFQSSTLMLNAYIDLGTAGGITPYVGAGIGGARNVFSSYTRTIEGEEATQERLSAGDDYSFAWALMAGVGIKLSPNAALDLGYRYISLGDAQTLQYGTGSGTRAEALGAHEWRVGLRYGFP